MRKCSLINELKCDIKEAQLLHSKSNLKKAKFVLRTCIEKFESTLTENSECADIEYYIKALDLYAQLLNETKSENPSVIIKDLLEKSLLYISKYNLDSSAEKFSLIFDSFYSLAKFADTQYQNICDYVKSKAFEEHSELMRKFQVESNKTKLIEPNSHFNFILQKQYDIDREDVNSLLENKENFLCKSIKNYLYCLELGSNQQTDNFCIFRLVSLWTQNSSNLNANKTIEEKIFNIPTYKFLILIHQLAARMSLKAQKNQHSENSNSQEDCSEQLFQTILIKLITNITHDHPHHCLPIIFAFSNSHKDYLLTNNNSSSKSDVNNYLMTEDRVNTANSILNELRSKSNNLKLIIDSMSQVCEAYIELANTTQTPKPKPNEQVPFGKHLQINKIKNFNLVNVLTNSMPINYSARYDEAKLVYIVKFDSKFRVANGINAPKIVLCLGSDGVYRKQLVKGKDDLRQDAVMQQFFSTVNDLINFNNNKQNTIKLNTIRTYKILPLSQKSGVLEWCQNTITFGK